MIRKSKRELIDSIKIDGIPCQIEVYITAGCRGSRDSLGGIPNAGPPLEPDDPDEFEITEIYDRKGYKANWLWEKLKNPKINEKVHYDIDKALRY